MRQLAALMVFLLGSVMFLAAQDQDKDKSAGMDSNKAGTMEMTGAICNAKCVKQEADKSSCDASCKENSGDLVFVDDQGKTYKINNQKMAKKHAGKKVKMTGSMKGDTMDPSQILDLGAYGPG